MRYFYVTKVAIKQNNKGAPPCEITHIKELKRSKVNVPLHPTHIAIPGGDGVCTRILTPIKTSFYNVVGSIVGIDSRGCIHVEKIIPLAFSTPGG